MATAPRNVLPDRFVIQAEEGWVLTLKDLDDSEEKVRAFKELLHKLQRVVISERYEDYVSDWHPGSAADDRFLVSLLAWWCSFRFGVL